MTGPVTSVSSVRLFGIEMDDATLDEASAWTIAMAQAGQTHDVAFVNAHCVNLAVAEPAYRDALHHFSRRYADGSGMRLAARLAGHQLRDNVNGTDLFPLLCERAARLGIPIALLGARPGVAQRCADAMSRRFAGLQVAWVHHGYATDAEMPEVLASLADSGAGLLFVAMGVPAQELWIRQHRPALKVPVTLAVGALFDFYSGDVRRAPRWLRRLGLEWVFRLALEPRRLYLRYIIGNPLFVFRALRLALQGRLRDTPIMSRDGSR